MIHSIALTHGFSVHCTVEEDGVFGTIDAVLLRDGRQQSFISRTFAPGRSTSPAPHGALDLGNGFAVLAEATVEDGLGEAGMILLHNGVPDLHTSQTFSPTHDHPNESLK